MDAIEGPTVPRVNNPRRPGRRLKARRKLKAKSQKLTVSSGRTIAVRAISSGAAARNVAEEGPAAVAAEAAPARPQMTQMTQPQMPQTTRMTQTTQTHA